MKYYLIKSSKNLGYSNNLGVSKAHLFYSSYKS